MQNLPEFLPKLRCKTYRSFSLSYVAKRQINFPPFQYSKDFYIIHLFHLIISLFSFHNLLTFPFPLFVSFPFLLVFLTIAFPFWPPTPSNTSFIFWSSSLSFSFPLSPVSQWKKWFSFLLSCSLKISESLVPCLCKSVPPPSII